MTDAEWETMFRLIHKAVQTSIAGKRKPYNAARRAFDKKIKKMSQDVQTSLWIVQAPDDLLENEDAEGE